MSKKIIEIRNIHKAFSVGEKDISVLDNIDFDIYKGEFIMIVGPSGSGKSTLLSILNGWQDPEHGDIYINKKNIYLRTEKERNEICQRTMSLVQQTPSWIKSLDTKTNVALPLMIKGISRKEALWRAEQTIDLLDLSEFSKHNPLDLSGGQQQRIALLRSLIDNPEVLIADEPTGNLDSGSTIILMFLLEKLHKELGKTIIMATHDLSLLHYATRVVYINKGKLEKIEEMDKGFKPKSKSGDILDIKKDSSKSEVA